MSLMKSHYFCKILIYSYLDDVFFIRLCRDASPLRPVHSCVNFIRTTSTTVFVSVCLFWTEEFSVPLWNENKNKQTKEEKE